MFFTILEKGEKMNRIIYILLTIVFFQLIGIGYMKIIDKQQKDECNTPKLNKLVNESIKDILHASKKLPQSTEYTVWDKEIVQHIGQKVLQSTEQQIWNPKEIKHLSQKILQESKINSIAITKEKKIALNNINLKRKPKQEKVKAIKKKTIKKPKSISIDQKLEKYAKAKLGQKYVWGATGPNQFDCSGFTRYIFRSTAGIQIPRVSRDQSRVGQYIKNIKDLRRGDMVFFDTEKKFKGKVNHVGIYLSNGNFIHASSARKKVIITNFRKKPFYKRRFLWGRRVINTQCKS